MSAIQFNKAFPFHIVPRLPDICILIYTLLFLSRHFYGIDEGVPVRLDSVVIPQATFLLIRRDINMAPKN